MISEMQRMRSLVAILCVAAAVIMIGAWAAGDDHNPGGATFDANGTARITRTIPVPASVSAEAQQWLASLTHRKFGPQTLEERRAATDKWRAEDSAEARKLFAVDIQEKNIGGVRTDVITPKDWPEANRKRVLINLHGGGFNSDSGSQIEGVPIAALAKTRVVGVYYRLAPENPFPAAVDDVVSVYRELLKEYKPQSVGIFGTSAGAVLTGEVTAKMKQLGLPMPGALGMFSTAADFARPSESRYVYTLEGLPGPLLPMDPAEHDPYVGNTDRKNPVLSPVYADLHGWPPSLLVASTRDLLLSDTAIFHRALLNAGTDTQLVVYEALPHAFWYHFQMPETREALQTMANFFDQKVQR